MALTTVDSFAGTATKANLRLRPVALAVATAFTAVSPAGSAATPQAQVMHFPAETAAEPLHASLWIAPADELTAAWMSEISVAIHSSGAKRIHPLEGVSWGARDLQGLIEESHSKITHLIEVAPLRQLQTIDEALRDRIHRGEITAFESADGWFVLVDTKFLR